MKIILLMIFVIITNLYSQKDFEIIVPKDGDWLRPSDIITFTWRNRISDSTTLSYYDFEKKQWFDIITTSRNQYNLEVDGKFKDSVLFRITTKGEQIPFNINYTNPNNDIISYDYLNNTSIQAYNNGTMNINSIYHSLPLRINRTRFRDVNNIIIGHPDGVALYNINSRVLNNLIIVIRENETHSTQFRGIFYYNNYGYFGNDEGKIYKYNFINNSIEKMIQLEQVYDMKVRDDYVLVSSWSGTTYKLDLNLNIINQYEKEYKNSPIWSSDILNGTVVNGGIDGIVRIFKNDTTIKIKLGYQIRTIQKLNDTEFLVGGTCDTLIDGTCYLNVYDLDGTLLCRLDAGGPVIEFNTSQNQVSGVTRKSYFWRNNTNLCNIVSEYIKVYIERPPIINNSIYHYDSFNINIEDKIYNIYGIECNHKYLSNGIYIILKENKFYWIYKL